MQTLPADIKRGWKFFADPRNLLTITPPFLNLKVTKEVGEEVYPGQIITYVVKPLLNIPMFWMTEITHVEREKFFVDEQRKGPYKLWHHQHHFKTTEKGVEMNDIVHYRLPFGVLGSIANDTIVRKKLKEIFGYRYQKINELFGNTGEEMQLDFK